MVQEITDSTFEKEVLKSDKPVIVDYWAPWCVDPDTEILRSDNSTVLAKKISKNDNLLTYNNKNIVSDIVVRSYTSNKLGHCKEISTKDKKIKVTDEHEFLTKNGWKQAINLVDGEKVAMLSQDKKNLVFENIKEINNIHLPAVQKITMKVNHNFIANNFLVHNCGPCRAMAPVFEELSKEMKDVKFVKMDVDDNQEVASKYNIMSIPTFIVFKNGKEVGREIGGMPKDAIKTRISGHLLKA